MRNQKSGMFTLICLAALIAVFAWYGAEEKSKKFVKQVQSEQPPVVKIKEVIGQVVGGPQIVTGSPLIGYAVYIQDTKSWGALHANGCLPGLGNGQRVVMHQKDTLGEWYTFLRYEK